jgi:hypothetical protein
MIYYIIEDTENQFSYWSPDEVGFTKIDLRFREGKLGGTWPKYEPNPDFTKCRPASIDEINAGLRRIQNKI